jgi:hypothetical protein
MKKEQEVRRDKASPSSSEEAPGGSSSSSESKFCVKMMNLTCQGRGWKWCQNPLHHPQHGGSRQVHYHHHSHNHQHHQKLPGELMGRAGGPLRE